MYEGNRIAVLIAAGGRGSRMGSPQPKQFLKLGTKTLLENSTDAFISNALVDDIYIIIPHGYENEARKINSSKIRYISKGGETRQQSVYSGLSRIDSDTDIVLIHDAARPYVDEELIDRVIKCVCENGAAVPAIPVKDTVKIVENDSITDTPDRTFLYSAQTPQGFRYDLIMKAHERAVEDGFVGTDDSQLVERLGYKVRMTNGDERNIKVTVPEDIQKTDNLIGLGFDVHAFSEGRDLIIGGVKIPYEKGLEGHSDADVLVHALMDAILGALNLGDIGTNFPDTDMRYKDISSTLLLTEVRDKMAQKGYTLHNADLIIVAEKPKMKTYIKDMKERLAEILKTDPTKISIKATTTEGLGFTGREEGMGAQAIVQLTGLSG